MRRASLWMFLMAVLILSTMAAAEDYQVQFLPEDQRIAAPAIVPCDTEPSLAAILSPMQQADMKATYTTTSAGACCSLYGCCTHVQSGCEQCSGGRRWFSIYNCANYPGATCKIYPVACPTPC